MVAFSLEDRNMHVIGQAYLLLDCGNPKSQHLNDDKNGGKKEKSLELDRRRKGMEGKRTVSSSLLLE